MTVPVVVSRHMVSARGSPTSTTLRVFGGVAAAGAAWPDGAPAVVGAARMSWDPSKPIELKFLGGGGNFARIGAIIAVEMSGYYNRLPEGSTASIPTYHPGVAAMQAPMLVGNDDFHLAVTTPAWYAQSAMDGKTQTAYDTNGELRALCNFPHDDRFFMLVRKDTG